MTTVSSFVLVFLGGGLGSICRYAIASMGLDTSGSFPWATWIANMLSCILLGWLIAKYQNDAISESYRFFLMTGFCGGFSTFSTFSAENFELLQNDQYLMFLLYAGGSVVFGLLSILAGYYVAQL